jgi:hypothetical protein
LAAEHKKELERVKEEKRDIEKVSAFEARLPWLVGANGATPHFLQAIYKIEAGGERGILDFTNTAVSDMPPKLRTVFEENKVC